METSQVCEKASSQEWLILLAVGLGTFLFSLDVNIVNIALPTLAEELGSNFATIKWVLLSYSLVLSALGLCIAQLGDIWSKKRLFFPEPWVQLLLSLLSVFFYLTSPLVRSQTTVLLP